VRSENLSNLDNEEEIVEQVESSSGVKFGAHHADNVKEKKRRRRRRRLRACGRLPYHFGKGDGVDQVAAALRD